MIQNWVAQYQESPGSELAISLLMTSNLSMTFDWLSKQPNSYVKYYWVLKVPSQSQFFIRILIGFAIGFIGIYIVSGSAQWAFVSFSICSRYFQAWSLKATLTTFNATAADLTRSVRVKSWCICILFPDNRLNAVRECIPILSNRRSLQEETISRILKHVQEHVSD